MGGTDKERTEGVCPRGRRWRRVKVHWLRTLVVLNVADVTDAMNNTVVREEELCCKSSCLHFHHY